MQLACVRSSVQLNFLATGALTVNASVWGATGQYMLSRMAFRNNPAAAGDTRLAHRSMAPELSPATVMSAGSPPNRRMLDRTQRIAAC